MSNPRNPLDAFRSYSYHHILIACDGSNTAEELATKTEISLFDHEGAEQRFCPRTVPGSDGKYVVLINGMSDVQFNITEAKWASVLTPRDENSEGSSHYRTMAVDGELTIMEPFGVNFLNLLNEVTKLLGTDPNGVVMMLKTIFVGETDEGRTKFVSNVKPLLFIAYDITAMFDVTGAEYTLAFVGVSNGAGRLPHVAAVADGFNLELKSGSTIQNAMDNLTTAIKQNYKLQKDSIRSQSQTSGVDIDFERDFIDVNYIIRVDGAYAPLKIGGNALPAEQNTGNDDPIVNVNSDSISVESMIDSIMSTSTEVKKIDQEEDDTGNKFYYKITSTLETSPTEYNVIYHVHRKKTNIVRTEEIFDFTPPKGSGIEFDYIFTGQNIDVKDFDIKMQMGMTFFQTMAVESSLPTNADSIINKYNNQPYAAGTGNVNGSGDQKEESSICDASRRRKKPLFLGMTAKDIKDRNTRFPGLSTSYNALLARHAAIENLEVNMTIRGNPQLLAETTQLPSDLDPTIQRPEEILDFGLGEGSTVFAKPHQFPAFAKVNIYMPNEFQSNTGNITDVDYSQNFWYPGWYFVLGINHVFSAGEFTQELEMYSMPTEASQSKLNNTDENLKAGSASGTSEGDVAKRAVFTIAKNTTAATGQGE